MGTPIDTTAAPPPARAPLMTVEEALQRLLQAVQPLDLPVEEAPLEEADGRVLAADVVAALDVPGFDNSQMDGYAVRAADVAAAVAEGRALPVAQRIAAGAFGAALQPGTVARIFTGAPLPTGADAVVMQEEAQPGEPPPGADATLGAHGWVRFASAPALGQWVRRRGEDVARGAVALAAGLRLRPAHLGVAASLGVARLPVRRRLRVALAPTGDELVQPGTVPPERLPPGAIYNSSRYALVPLLRRLGFDVTVLPALPDERAATERALAQAALTHDALLTTGGVSVGEADHVKPAVQALGGLDLWQVSMKPGKPFMHGFIDRERLGGQGRCHVFGLPGNPVSSLVTFLLLARPALLWLAGAAVTPALPPALLARADFDWPRPDKRREFVRVRRNADGALEVFPNQNSSVLTSVAWADGLADIVAGRTLRRGELVPYWPLADFLA
ncbi:Molybdopterin molybdenumtransferase [Tepidimonas alkaliphilus]|uniref:Molybdopterin molybdenumtransferase n=1 Tax=Tepidimonas alkaliphilus TaxID=2588942 RepID=A0A554WA48_9BURK|nr:gephyrin-like molybdotransferase Glp [Tepidimonas alkaliphilus]TSE20451.1 Molybdopterin molybdenumtransferase [Tepidimonas alkaliphilus]